MAPDEPEATIFYLQGWIEVLQQRLSKITQAETVEAARETAFGTLIDHGSQPWYDTQPRWPMPPHIDPTRTPTNNKGN